MEQFDRPSFCSRGCARTHRDSQGSNSPSAARASDEFTPDYIALGISYVKSIMIMVGWERHRGADANIGCADAGTGLCDRGAGGKARFVQSST